MSKKPEKPITEWTMPKEIIAQVTALEDEVIGMSAQFQNLDMQLEQAKAQIRQAKQEIVNKQREKRALSKIAVEQAIKTLGGTVPEGWEVHFNSDTNKAIIIPPRGPMMPPQS